MQFIKDMQLKVLSYNIHKGYGWSKEYYSLKDIRALIKATESDIVFLQEVVGRNIIYKKKGLIDAQFEFLAESVWPHYAYAHNALYDHGHCGNLILSKYPIESWENINLTTNSLEKRGLLVCKIHIPASQKKYVYVACVHLDLLHRGRVQQYNMIKNKITSLDSVNDLPLIIAGDFNDWNRKSGPVFEEELGMVEAHKHVHGKLAYTFPAGLPFFSLDRIYVKNVIIHEAHIVKPPPQIENKKHFSDHLPLLCRIEIPGSDAHAV